MKLLAILLCLFIERFFIHSFSYQRFWWFKDYFAFIIKALEKSPRHINSWMTLGVVILPVIILMSLIYLLFHSLLFGFGGLILNVVILLYCLGPQKVFYPLSSNDSQLVDKEYAGKYFVLVNSQLFAVLFWYILLGPLVVLAYRLLTLCKAFDSVHKEATQVTNIVEWIPARITSLLFLFAGNFQRGFSSFMQYFFTNPNANHQMLAECGFRAVQVNESEEISVPHAEALVDHATIVLVVFIALFTLVAWL